MPRYIVLVRITNTPRDKEITVYAASEEEAEQKACYIVSGWDGVDDVEALEVEEDS